MSSLPGKMSSSILGLSHINPGRLTTCQRGRKAKRKTYLFLFLPLLYHIISQFSSLDFLDFARLASSLPRPHSSCCSTRLLALADDDGSYIRPCSLLLELSYYW